MWHNAILPLVFCFSVSILFYTYLGYPIVIYLLGKIRARKKCPDDAKVLPTVTVVLAAFNEEQRIKARLLNLLDTQYPADRFDVVLVSDGSTDSTIEQARSINDHRIQVLA